MCQSVCLLTILVPLVSDEWVDEYSRHQVAQIDDLHGSRDLVSGADDKWAGEYLENAM